MIMKLNHRQLLVLCAVLFLAANGSAESTLTQNQFRYSARIGFNVSGKFTGIGNGLFTGSTPSRLTPNGDAYNYDDGYLLTDVSDNYGGETWYVGYDDSSAQISGNNLLLSHSTASADVDGKEEDADVSVGFEIGYQAQIGHNAKNTRGWGFEVFGGWQPISISSRGQYAGNVTRVTDSYAFTPGTTPPTATPGAPYQGSYGGAGFLFGDALAGTSTQVIPGGVAVDGRHELEGGLLEMRVGFYVEQVINEKWGMSLSGGFATGLIHVDGDWSESAPLAGGGTASLSGSENDIGAQFGFYAGAQTTYDLGKNWRVAGGVQYQFLNDYDHDFDGRRAELDFSGSFFVTIGISKTF